MSSASLALLLFVASGTLGLLGLWQLLAGGSRRAELAARGQVVGDDGSGRSLVRALDVRLRRTRSGQRLASWLGGAGVKLLPAELIGRVDRDVGPGLRPALAAVRAGAGARSSPSGRPSVSRGR